MTGNIQEYIQTGRARAKINLTLHVGQAIGAGAYKGYHPVDSLVVFAGGADRLLFAPDKTGLKLDISGPFGEGLKAENDNLILKAAKAFFERENISPAGHFRLEKNLPLSSGIGGGSADAAAALRLLMWEHHGPDSLKADSPHHAKMIGIAQSIGADVPVCYISKTSRMSGIGEVVELMPGLGRVPALLVNPGFAVSTPEVFKAFDIGKQHEIPRPQGSGDLLSRAQAGRNDLQPVAISLRPEIGELIRSLSKLSGCQLARMSGSGATCFALFETFEQAAAARDLIAAESPDYWCIATLLGDC